MIYTYIFNNMRKLKNPSILYYDFVKFTNCEPINKSILIFISRIEIQGKREF